MGRQLQVFVYHFAHLGPADMALQSSPPLASRADPALTQWASHAAELPFEWHYEFYVNQTEPAHTDVPAPLSAAEEALSRTMADLWGTGSYSLHRSKLLQ